MLRTSEHRYSPALTAQARLGSAHVGQLLLDPLEDLVPLFDVGQFAAAKPQHKLHAVATLDKLARVVDLDHQVMLADLGRADSDMFQSGPVSLGLGLTLFLPLGVHPFAEVHDAANGRG